MSNPKNEAGRAKPCISNLPLNVLLEVAEALREGKEKYGRYNWRDNGVDASAYIDGALRHIFAWWEGEDIDADSGINHLSKAIAGLLLVRDSQCKLSMNDDRWMAPDKSEAEYLLDIGEANSSKDAGYWKMAHEWVDHEGLKMTEAEMDRVYERIPTY